jgi:hypothetical protein
MIRPLLALLLLLPAACGPDQVAENAAVPALNVISESPGDWTALELMVDRTPADSGLIDDSPISVDLTAKLGPDLAAWRSAMMRAGPLRRQGNLLVARAPDAWLVLQPADHAMRLALRSKDGWREWETAGATVPRPAG